MILEVPEIVPDYHGLLPEMKYPERETERQLPNPAKVAISISMGCLDSQTWPCTTQ